MANDRPPTFLVVVASLAIVVALFYWLATRRSGAPAGAIEQVTQAAREPAPAPAPPPTIDPEAARRAALKLAKAEQKGLLDRATAIRKVLDTDFPAEHARWERDVAALLTNSTGRAIGASEPHTVAFYREYDAPRPTLEAVESLRSQLAFLLPAIREAYQDANSTFVPDATFQRKLEEIGRDADAAVSAYGVRREAIARIARLADEDQPNPPDVTLTDAARGRRDRAEAERLAREQGRLDDERRDALANEERAAAEARKQREEGAAAQRAEDMARAERRLEVLKKANDPAYQKAFALFLNVATTRVGIGGRYPDGRPHPAAFDDIQQAGGFSSPSRLAFIAAHPDGGRGQRTKGNPSTLQTLFPDLQEVAGVWVAQCKLLKSADDVAKPCTATIP